MLGSKLQSVHRVLGMEDICCMVLRWIIMWVRRDVAGVGRVGGEPGNATIPGGRVKRRKNGRKVNILNKNFFFVQQILIY